MKQYKQNMANKDDLFEQRRANAVASSNNSTDIVESLAEEDPWTSAKKNEEVKEEVNEETVSRTMSE
jgi:hypothetical protein